jgi:YVTN family beta-propeller protein
MLKSTAAFLLACTPAFAAPDYYPKYVVGARPDGSIVMSTGQIITPAGKQVDLGVPVRAKAIALNPNGATHSGAVLQMGAAAAVQVFDLATGKVLQSFKPATGASGSYGGITYSADGSRLFFSQDSSDLAIASVDKTGLLSEFAEVALPPNDQIPLYSPYTAYPGGIAVSDDGGSAYVLLNQNNTLGVVDLRQSPPVLARQIRVGNVPNSVLVAHGMAYVSNEGGAVARPGEFTDASAGTQIVSDRRTDSALAGTVSVVDLASGEVRATIKVGLHPTGMALADGLLYVANTYGDTIFVIDTKSHAVVRTMRVGVPLGSGAAFGAMPTGLAVDGLRLYVTLYSQNAIAVVDLSVREGNPVIGYIPTASTPGSIALDRARHQLVVSCDKGVGTQGKKATLFKVTGFNSHPDSGKVELVAIPSNAELARDSAQVALNNHWDLTENVRIGAHYADPHAKPVAIPLHIGEPSLIRHVFLIIKENRTYDQVFGDVATGWGNASLAVFGRYTPNQHALMQRFAMLDNVYAPSRQSADGHPWIVSGIAPYADEIQSPDWIRSYPGGNSEDEMVYTPRGFLWDAVTAKGLRAVLYGEWSGTQTIDGNYTWRNWFDYSRMLEGTSQGTSRITRDSDTETSTVPSVAALLDAHFPSFNLGIPDQYRVDYWLTLFRHQEETGTLPALTIMWLPNDHTSGYRSEYPIPQAAVADNDLALGRIVEAVSHGKDWPTAAIFVEEDDAQNGVDHIDGHRQPVQVISPYAVQSNGKPDHSFYTAANINRTIEQILGLTPMTQFELVASPMRTAFTDTPNFAPFTHLPSVIALDTFPDQNKAARHAALERAWMRESERLLRGKEAKADAVDDNALNHVIWYAATGFDRAYPGEAAVVAPKVEK